MSFHKMALQVIQDLFIQENPQPFFPQKGQISFWCLALVPGQSFWRILWEPIIEATSYLTRLIPQASSPSSSLDTLGYFSTIHMIGHSGHEGLGMISHVKTYIVLNLVQYDHIWRLTECL